METRSVLESLAEFFISQEIQFTRTEDSISFIYFNKEIELTISFKPEPYKLSIKDTRKEKILGEEATIRNLLKGTEFIYSEPGNFTISSGSDSNHIRGIITSITKIMAIIATINLAEKNFVLEIDKNSFKSIFEKYRFAQSKSFIAFIYYLNSWNIEVEIYSKLGNRIFERFGNFQCDLREFSLSDHLEKLVDEIFKSECNKY